MIFLEGRLTEEVLSEGPFKATTKNKAKGRGAVSPPTITSSSRKAGPCCAEQPAETDAYAAKESVTVPITEGFENTKVQV